MLTGAGQQWGGGTSPPRDYVYHALNEIMEQLRQLDDRGSDGRRAHVYRNVIAIVLERHANEQSRNGERYDHPPALFRGRAGSLAPGVPGRQAAVIGAGTASQQHRRATPCTRCDEWSAMTCVRRGARPCTLQCLGRPIAPPAPPGIPARAADGGPRPLLPRTPRVHADPFCTLRLVDPTVADDAKSFPGVDFRCFFPGSTPGPQVQVPGDIIILHRVKVRGAAERLTAARASLLPGAPGAGRSTWGSDVARGEGGRTVPADWGLPWP